MKHFFAKPWVRLVLLHVGIAAGTLAAYALFAMIFGNACPYYAILGINCPFCGMTRAHAALLRLDLAAAFSYHPVFFVGIPFLWMLFHKGFFEGKWKTALWWTVVIGCASALLITYAVRVITTGGFYFFG